MTTLSLKVFFNDKKEFCIAIFSLLLLTVMYVVIGSSTWAVNPIESPLEFCEKIAEGLVKEPMNSFSNFSYIIVGLVILWNIPSKILSANNPMLDRSLYPILYGLGSIYIGVGSFAMHGTNTHWGASMDWTGMLFFISFPVFYNLSREYGWNYQFFAVIFFGVFILTVIVDTYAVISNPILIEDYSGSKNLRLQHITRDYLWSLYIGVWIIQETKNVTNNSLIWMVSLPLIACLTLSVGAPVVQLVVLCILFASIAVFSNVKAGRKITRKPTPSLWLGLGAYLIANVVWRMGRDGEDTCNPESLFQYHALWHLLTGLAVYFFYRYFTTETMNDSISEQE